MDDLQRLRPPPCTKVFIQRDYTDGCGVKFMASPMPPELERKIDAQTFSGVISDINAILTEAEALSAKTCCESCLACLTAYLLYLCMSTSYERNLKKVTQLVTSVNDKKFLPNGMLMVDPSERGLRVIEICIFDNQE